MASKVIHALYSDDDILLQAVKKVREKHYHIEEVYTPFPVHGLEKAMGLADTRIAITSFLYGLVGLSIAVLMMNFIMLILSLGCHLIFSRQRQRHCLRRWPFA